MLYIKQIIHNNHTTQQRGGGGKGEKKSIGRERGKRIQKREKKRGREGKEGAKRGSNNSWISNLPPWTVLNNVYFETETSYFLEGIILDGCNLLQEDIFSAQRVIFIIPNATPHGI